ncbi:signal transduction histidine kinase [Crassisporium funariophilum]|nr:signal transduction histidine kinase [Crassisporium funariophilum]
MPAIERAPISQPLPTPNDGPLASRCPAPITRPTTPPTPPSPPRPKSPGLKALAPEPAAKRPSVPDRPASPPSRPEPPATRKDDTPPPDDDEDVVDMDTFYQILELDEDEDTHDFSKPMVWAYFEQAGKTFEEMDDAMLAKDLPTLSALGHFLKGSSAALGLSKVQASCEKIQHYGVKRDEELNKDLTADEALKRIQSLLIQVKVEYSGAERWLKNWFNEAEGA